MNRLLAWFITFNFINLTWVFFREKEWEDAIKVLKGMFGGSIVLPLSMKESLDSLSQHGVKFGYWLQSISRDDYTMLWIAAAFIVTLALKNSNQMTERMKPNYLTVLYATILFLAAASSLSKLSEFLYFNF